MVVQRMNIAPDNVLAYDVEVEDARHIPDLVEITQELGSYTPVIIGLDHRQEPHAMRGRYEKLGDLKKNEVFRRPDGGQTVYTDSSKYALNFGVNLDSGETKKADTGTTELHDFVAGRTGRNLDRGERDLYLDGVVAGDQVVGTSSRFQDDSAVLRAYWAEDIPDVYDLMYRDGFDYGEIARHRKAMERSREALEGLYRRTMDEFHADKLTSTELLEKMGMESGKTAAELLEEEGVRNPDACFLRKSGKQQTS
jgi:hypothetical protein